MSAQSAAQGAARACAHPNIALVKYWGKADAAANLPAVASLSITLSDLVSDTQVTFDGAGPDRIVLDDAPASDADAARLTAFLDLFRARAGTQARATVRSSNNFPTAAGLASSASGFAALAVAADAALGLGLTPAELSALARRGSGSAARSVFGGFVAMAGPDEPQDHARELLSAEAWPLHVVIAITSRARKRHASTDGMNLTRDTSPYYPAWLAGQRADMNAALDAVARRDFAALAAVAEHSCLKMHGLMLSARPGLIYWNAATLAGIETVRRLQDAGEDVFFTIDAGPQLKAVCTDGSREAVAAALARTPGVVDVLSVGLGGPARIVADG